MTHIFVPCVIFDCIPNLPAFNLLFILSPKDISEFKKAILASAEIRALVKTECGNQSDEKWADLQRGLDLGWLYSLIHDNMHRRCNLVSTIKGAAPDDDTFDIDIFRLGPLFSVTAIEFDSLEYFGSLTEAEGYAEYYFSSFIEQFSERG